MNQKRFPEVQGVSVGAILSNYQRVRVEHVSVLASMSLLNQAEDLTRCKRVTDALDSA